MFAMITIRRISPPRLLKWKKNNHQKCIPFYCDVITYLLFIIVMSESTTGFDDTVSITNIIPDLRTIELHWIQRSIDGTSLEPNSSFLVKYCEDSPWDELPMDCKSFITNGTSCTIRDLRPSSKYLVAVEAVPFPAFRAGRIILPDFYGNRQGNEEAKKINPILDRDKAIEVETQKYAIRNVECLKGETNVTVETGEDFEGLISVQKPDGSPDLRCVVRGFGMPQRTYVLNINHSTCSVDFSKNGTMLDAILLIQEHAVLVLGSDRSFRITCDYQPAVIHLQTGIGSGTQVLGVERPGSPKAHVPINFQLNTNVVMPNSGLLFDTTTSTPLLPVTISTLDTQKTSSWLSTKSAILFPIIGKSTQQVAARHLKKETISSLSSTQKSPPEISSRFSSPQRLLDITVSSALDNNSAGERAAFSRLVTQGPNNATAEDSYGNPLSLRMSMLQIIVVSLSSSFAVILLLCLLIWWMLNRHKFTSCKRPTKADIRALEAERYG